MNTVQAQIEVVESAGNLVPASILQFKSKVQSLKQAGVLLVESYYDVVTHVRDFQISPDVVTDTLKTEGFAPSRISEFKRIAFSVPQIYEEYKAKTIGFKLALKKSRDAEKAKEEPSESAEDNASESEVAPSSNSVIPKRDSNHRSDQLSALLLPLVNRMDAEQYSAFYDDIQVIVKRHSAVRANKSPVVAKKANAKTKNKK